MISDKLSIKRQPVDRSLHKTQIGRVGSMLKEGGKKRHCPKYPFNVIVVDRGGGGKGNISGGAVCLCLL